VGVHARSSWLLSTPASGLAVQESLLLSEQHKKGESLEPLPSFYITKISSKVGIFRRSFLLLGGRRRGPVVDHSCSLFMHRFVTLIRCRVILFVRGLLFIDRSCCVGKIVNMSCKETDDSYPLGGGWRNEGTEGED